MKRRTDEYLIAVLNQLVWALDQANRNQLTSAEIGTTSNMVRTLRREMEREEE